MREKEKEREKRSKKEKAKEGRRNREKEETVGEDPLCALVCNYSRACTETIMTSLIDPVGANTRQTQVL